MGVDALSVVISTMAIPTMIVRTIGKILYLPVLVISRPDTIDVPITPTIIGSMRRPDAAADVPDDICRNVGTKPRAANIPMPIAMPIAVALMKIGLRNIDSGMIGSAARDSVKMNNPAAATRPAPHAQVAPESQPKSADPPKSVKKMRHVVAADRNTTPSQSMGFSAFLFGSFRANTATKKAA